MNKNSKSKKEYTVQDALFYSLDERGKVDISYMSELSGKSREELIDELYGVIFQNPESFCGNEDEGWETADQYLSGNIYQKYNVAVYACKVYGPQFESNVNALDNVFPKNLKYADIYVTLGSPWIPTDIIDDFIYHLLGEYSYFRSSEYNVKHDTITGKWEIPKKNRYGAYHVLSTAQYGTSDIDALNIIEKTLNHQTIVIRNPHQQPYYAVNRTPEEATMLAQDKQNLIIEEFSKWLWSDETRAQRILDIYQRNYGCYRARHINGAYLKLKDMNSSYKLFPFQKDAVARIIMTPNTLLAHEVGAGKTLIMIAACMELRRLGKSKRNLFVVPNNILEQWHSMFLTLYPSADVLVVSPDMFSPANRKETLNRIKNEDHDAIIMAYSSFDSINCSRDWKKKECEAKLKRLENEYSISGHDTMQLKRQLAAIRKEYDKYSFHSHYASSSKMLSFDELGINTLFVDEAHNYKNIPLKSSIKLLGINNSGSKKCDEMLSKVRCVQLQNNGRGVVMATGTPITNSISDVYAFQRYLQYDDLFVLGISGFTDWVGMYAGQDTNFEIDVDTSNFRIVSRLSRFHNIPELTTLFSQVVDFHQMNKSGLPRVNGREDCVIPATPEFRQFLGEISDRVDAIRARRSGERISRKPDFMNNRRRRAVGQPLFKANDNLLCVTTDGRKGALDLRLVNYPVINYKLTKVYACARNVFSIYEKTKVDNSTQLIFCDTSTPKREFNVYDELKRHLILLGAKAEDIAFIHDYEDESLRQELFEKVQSGEVRILIGSTFKLGLGVNVQNKLIALHHLDVPWRPADMTQREGRILRQGNTNEEVKIYRYVTEESFDAYSWQLLETKQRFITEILSGIAEARSGEEVGNTELDYSEVKALAIGNPEIKARVMLNNELVKYRTLQKAVTTEYEELNLEKERTKKLIFDSNSYIEHLKKDVAELVNEISPNAERSTINTEIYKAINDDGKSTNVVTYRGFDVITPDHKFIPDPFVYLQGDGKYIVHVGKGSRLILSKIDKFIDSMPEKLEKAINGRIFMLRRIAEIEDTLRKLPDYTDKIEELQSKLDELDLSLGINDMTVRSRVLSN